MFFINGSGRPLGKIQNVPGSLLAKIGDAVKVKNLTLTKIRKAAEVIIQQNESMKSKGRILNNHSQKVGQDIYDITNSRIRVEYVGFMEKIEKKKGSDKKVEKNYEREERKKQMEMEDEELRLEHAKQFLESEDIKRKRNLGFHKRCNVRPNDKTLLQKAVFKDIFNSKVQKFPNENDWKSLFYRYIDSDGNLELKRIEFDIFQHIKIDVESYTGKWNGSVEQNKLADKKIAAAIRSSFKSYEKLGIRRDGQFFKFC